MSNYDQDQDPYDYDDDARFYEETIYNEEYYIEQERELIQQFSLRKKRDVVIFANAKELRTTPTSSDL